VSGSGGPEGARRIDLSRAIGMDPGRLAPDLGEPRTDRTVGEERWLLFETGDLVLRLRCRRDDGDGGGGRIASWTATWRPPRPTLRRATEPLGVWPAASRESPVAKSGDSAPSPPPGPTADPRAGSSDVPLLRYALPDPDAGTVHSLTVLRGPRGFSRVAAFDEPPEWR